MSASFATDLDALRGFGERWIPVSKRPENVEPLSALLPDAKPLERPDEELLLRTLIRREASLLGSVLAAPEAQREWRVWCVSEEATSKKDSLVSDPLVVLSSARRGPVELDRLGVARVHRAGFLRHFRKVTQPMPAQLEADFERVDNALQTLVFRNLRFALWATWIPALSTRESLLLGVLGFIEALDRFENERSRLTTYARQWVKARKSLASRRWVGALRDSGHTSGMRMKIRAAVAEVRSEGAEPGLSGVMEAVEGVEARRVVEAYWSRRTGQRLATDGVGGGPRLLDLALEGAPAQAVRAAQLMPVWMVVATTTAGLPARERHIAVARLGLEPGDRPTLSELGRVHGLSRERVRQLEKTAFEAILGAVVKSLAAESEE